MVRQIHPINADPVSIGSHRNRPMTNSKLQYPSRSAKVGLRGGVAVKESDPNQLHAFVAPTAIDAGGGADYAPA